MAGTNTGKSPQLAGYYQYWEMAVFNALVLMVLKALEKIHNMLSSLGKKPLFKVCSPESDRIVSCLASCLTLKVFAVSLQSSSLGTSPLF